MRKGFKIIFVAGMLMAAQSVCAMDGLQSVLKEAAQRIASFVKEQHQNTVAIRDFTAPPKLQSNFGNAIAIDLQSNLKALNITVDDKAAYEVVGKYRAVDNFAAGNPTAANNVLLVEIELFEQDTGKKVDAFFRNANNEPKGQLQVPVSDAGVVVAATGANGTLDDPMKEPSKNPNAKVGDIQKHPQFTLSGSTVTVGSYAMEILVKDTAGKLQGRTLTQKSDSPFVTFDQKEVYAVRLVNRSKQEMAATLTVDGVNVFTFSEVPGMSNSRYIIPANGSVEIPGWYKNAETAAEFKITDYPNSAAAKVRSTGKIGVINAVFAPAYKVYAVRVDPATGVGDDVKFKTNKVDRNFGPPAASITVRYGK
jgi:hypothetical protein